jgi:hypothetical protein
MLYDFLKHKPILIMPKLGKNLSLDPCDFQCVSESKFHRVFVNPIVEVVENSLPENPGFFSLSKIKRVFREPEQQPAYVKKVQKLKFWVKELSMLKKNFENWEFTVDISGYNKEQSMIFGPQYLYRNAVFTNNGVYILQISTGVYLLVDLLTQKHCFLHHQVTSKTQESKIYKAEHSVDKRNNLVVLFTDGTVQLVNLNFQNNSSMLIEGPTGSHYEFEQSTESSTIKVFKPLYCSQLADLSENNIDLKVTGNTITTIHSINIEKRKNAKSISIVKDSQLSYSELEIYRSLSHNEPL